MARATVALRNVPQMLTLDAGLHRIQNLGDNDMFVSVVTGTSAPTDLGAHFILGGKESIDLTAVDGESTWAWSEHGGFVGHAGTAGGGAVVPAPAMLLGSDDRQVRQPFRQPNRLFISALIMYEPLGRNGPTISASQVVVSRTATSFTMPVGVANANWATIGNGGPFWFVLKINNIEVARMETPATGHQRISVNVNRRLILGQSVRGELWDSEPPAA